MDDQELKNKEREQADNKMITDAFNHLIDTYLHSSHRRKVDIITKAFNSVLFICISFKNLSVFKNVYAQQS